MSSLSPRQIRVAFWNLQNLFDIEPSAIAQELGVSSLSGWDRRALEAKLTGIAGIIRGMFQGNGPDLIGLAELENDRVGQHLIDVLGRDDYVLVTASDPQLTATGTGLIYSKDIFEEQSVRVRSHLVHLRFPTCDVLEVDLAVCGSQVNLAVLVNHWPSRREQNSDAFRQTTASYCAKLIDQHLKLSRREYVELTDSELSRHRIQERWNRNLLLMGSFNDEPYARSVHDILNAGYSLRSLQRTLPLQRESLPSWRTYAACRPELFNPAWSLLSCPDRGTCVDSTSPQSMCVYDQIMLSSGLVHGRSGLQVAADSKGIPVIDCLAMETLTGESGHPVPFSCETCAGFSDRLPVGLTLNVTAATNGGSPSDADTPCAVRHHAGS